MEERCDEGIVGLMIGFADAGETSQPAAAAIRRDQITRRRSLRSPAPARTSTVTPAPSSVNPTTS